MITKQELDQIKASTLAQNYLDDKREGMRITVGMATCGIAAGAKPLYELMVKGTKDLDNTIVKITGCIGACRLEPMIESYNFV